MDIDIDTDAGRATCPTDTDGGERDAMVNGLKVDGSYDRWLFEHEFGDRKQQRIRLVRSGPPSPVGPWPATKARGSGRFSLPGHLMSWEKHDDLASTDIYGWGYGRNK